MDDKKTIEQMEKEIEKEKNKCCCSTIKLGEEPHSVKININQSGKMSAEIKCYADTPLKSLELAIKQKNLLKPLLDKNNDLIDKRKNKEEK